MIYFWIKLELVWWLCEKDISIGFSFLRDWWLCTLVTLLPFRASLGFRSRKSHHFWSLRSSFHACSRVNVLLWLLKKISWASLSTSFSFWPLLFSLVAASYAPQNLPTRSLFLCQRCLQWLGSLCSQLASFGLAAKYAAILFQKASDFCSFPTTVSLLVFNHELMSTTSSVGVHVLRSLRSAGESSPKRGSCDEDTSPLSCPKPKKISCWLFRRSTKFELWLLYG